MIWWTQVSCRWLLLAGDGRARRRLLREKRNTPQEHKRRGGSPAARGKRSLARKSAAVSQAVQRISSILFAFS
ncbi:hypothetical protein [Priestia megaterium]|uniref:hypothetical protein n=1 Tax=Priestia megaterium TaxID=1404 RepID=UPI00221E6EA9|nr:hypothetical protein [Priestia megaterium]MCZ8496135.1 hypothetical protein [Priestia megaterium]UYV55626.1 hypothetical protein OHU65_02770 [Priestia megaterium]